MSHKVVYSSNVSHKVEYHEPNVGKSSHKYQILYLMLVKTSMHNTISTKMWQNDVILNMVSSYKSMLFCQIKKKQF